MWKEFIIFGYRVVCKVYKTPSEFGIEGAERISKLAIYKGKQVFNYDRGHDFNELPEWVLNKLIDALDLLI